MADEKVLKAEIERSISMLCKRLNGRYINFFDSKTVPFGSRRPIGHELYIIPTGSYAFGEWRRGDDVRLVCTIFDFVFIITQYSRARSLLIAKD